MCGIAGVFGPLAREAPETAITLLRALRHRGPDGGGFAVAGDAAFAHARLAIHDPSPDGCQPFVAGCGDALAVANGEIHDALAWREKLAARGVAFRGRSDCEILLPAFRAIGPAFLETLEGPFALAIADTASRTLLLARDRAGEKPLFWARHDRSILFASDPGPLAAATRAATDRGFACDVLRMGYVPGPRTAFEGVHAVPPATILTFQDAAAPVARTWWTPPRPRPDATGTQARVAIESALHRAVARRLLGDRPVGAFLSGGLDSTAVLLLANRIRREPLPAFTLRFEGGPDESAAAALAARAVRSPHHVFTSDADPAALLRELTATSGAPLADPSLLAFAELARKAAAHATVFLTGDGGDEALAGYRRHRAARIAAATPAAMRVAAGLAARASGPRLARLLSPLRARPRAALADIAGLSPYCVLAGFLDEDARARGDPLLDLYDAVPAEPDPVADAARLDFLTQLPGDLLPKADRGAMASGVETRAPFLDADVLDAAFSLPGRLRASWREGKLPLRALLRGQVPDALLRRRKTGFSYPLGTALRAGPLARLVRELLRDVREPFRGVLRGGCAHGLLAAFDAGAPLDALVYAAAVVALHAATWHHAC